MSQNPQKSERSEEPIESTTDTGSARLPPVSEAWRRSQPIKVSDFPKAAYSPTTSLSTPPLLRNEASLPPTQFPGTTEELNPEDWPKQGPDPYTRPGKQELHPQAQLSSFANGQVITPTIWLGSLVLISALVATLMALVFTLNNQKVMDQPTASFQVLGTPSGAALRITRPLEDGSLQQWSGNLPAIFAALPVEEDLLLELTSPGYSVHQRSFQIPPDGTSLTLNLEPNKVDSAETKTLVTIASEKSNRSPVKVGSKPRNTTRDISQKPKVGQTAAVSVKRSQKPVTRVASLGPTAKLEIEADQLGVSFSVDGGPRLLMPQRNLKLAVGAHTMSLFDPIASETLEIPFEVPADGLRMVFDFQRNRVATDGKFRSIR